MKAIQFEAVVGSDQLIRPPVGVTLPQGRIEVAVWPVPEGSGDQLAPTRQWLLGAAAEAERMGAELPENMAEHHDHYAHGKPLP